MQRPRLPAPVRVEQPLERGRRTEKGNCELLTHYSHGKIDGFDPAQDIGNQVAVVEARRVAAICHLIVCRSVNIVENRTWQPSHSKFAEVMEIMAITQAHGDSKPSFRCVN